MPRMGYGEKIGKILATLSEAQAELPTMLRATSTAGQRAKSAERAGNEDLADAFMDVSYSREDINSALDGMAYEASELRNAVARLKRSVAAAATFEKEKVE